MLLKVAHERLAHGNRLPATDQAPPSSAFARMEAAALTVGERIETWVLEVADNHLWVGLSTTVTVFVLVHDSI